MNRLLIIIFIFFTQPVKLQAKNVYDEIQGKSYHPIIPGIVKNYISDLREYSTLFDTIYSEFNGKRYLRYTHDYGTFQSSAYYREDNGSVIYIKSEKEKETIEIPNNPKIGMIWYEGDSTWKYTITSINEILETPSSTYLNCLVIQSENLDLKKNPNKFQVYMQYYQRGRGFIGTKLGGLIYSYLIEE
ncbi:MAG: hypothetical protein KAX69_03115 [Chitinophagales bacterium]|nr:hypothetical protein [Chitinophagales bacterium]